MRKVFLPLFAFSVAACGSPVEPAGPLDSGFVTEYLTPTRVVCTSGAVENAEHLLKPYVGQVSTDELEVTSFGQGGYVLLDFGKEIQGGIGTNNTLGAGMEMRVMLCLFLASIPVQGGSGTKMHKMIIGVLTYFILDNGLTLLGNPSIVNQLIRAVVLLAALTLTRVISEQTVKRNIQKSLEDTAA